MEKENENKYKIINDIYEENFDRMRFYATELENALINIKNKYNDTNIDLKVIYNEAMANYIDFKYKNLMRKLEIKNLGKNM